MSRNLSMQTKEISKRRRIAGTVLTLSGVIVLAVGVIALFIGVIP